MGPRMTRSHPQITPTDPRVARIHTDNREAFQKDDRRESEERSVIISEIRGWNG